jgi:hypothetical protein
MEFKKMMNKILKNFKTIMSYNYKTLIGKCLLRRSVEKIEY